VFDNTGDKRGPHEAWTLLDPKTNESRIIVPSDFQSKLTKWCHEMLTHPGSNRLCDEMHQHHAWTNVSDDIRKFYKEHKHCQMAKRGLKGHGKVPLKEIEMQTWRNCCTDSSGPWMAHVNDGDTEFHALTLVDPFASWVETVPVKTKKAPHIRDLVLNHWFR